MKNCPRNIDKPFQVLGLDVEEVVFLLIWTGIIQVIFDVLIALATTIALIIVIKKIKAGKPRGYLMHFLYKKLNLKIKGLPPFKKTWRVW
ncbi:MAG: type IV conjugative transfer system protein TraL [Candidatus Micrarchaeia archaeon]